MHLSSAREVHESNFTKLNNDLAEILTELNQAVIAGNFAVASQLLIGAWRAASGAERELVGAGPGGVSQTQEILFKERLKALESVERQVNVGMRPPSAAAKAVPLALTAAAAVVGAVLLG